METIDRKFFAKISFNDVIGDVILHDIDLLFKSKIFKLSAFEKFIYDYLIKDER